MIDIKYVPSSQRAQTSGQQKFYDLKADGLKIREANFHNYSWKASGIENSDGMKVTNWKKEPITYDTSLYLKGGERERANLLDELHSEFERDIDRNAAGLLFWNGWYIECFITSSSTYPDNEGHTINEISIYCPYPFWTNEVTLRYKDVIVEKGDYIFLDYPNTYDYDYSGEQSGRRIVEIGHDFSSDFELTIFGPANNPRLNINGHIYQVNVQIPEGDYVIVNSRQSTVILVHGNTESNIFDLQYKQSDIFERINTEMVEFQWNGGFEFSIKLFLRSSEPKWKRYGDSV